MKKFDIKTLPLLFILAPLFTAILASAGYYTVSIMLSIAFIFYVFKKMICNK